MARVKALLTVGLLPRTSDDFWSPSCELPRGRRWGADASEASEPLVQWALHQLARFRAMEIHEENVLSPANGLQDLFRTFHSGGATLHFVPL